MIRDLLKQYEDTIVLLNSPVSSSGKFIQIINFFEYCEKNNFHPAPAVFIKNLIPVLITLLKSHSINFIDPYYFRKASFLLQNSKSNFADDVTLLEIDTVNNYIKMQLLKLYFYLGEKSEGLNILSNLLDTQKISTYYRQTDEHINMHDFENKYLPVKAEIFKKSRAIEILDEIRYEFERLNSFSCNDINLVLVQENSRQNHGGAGIIRAMKCSIEDIHKKEVNIELDNITDLQESNLNESLQIVIQSSQKLLHTHNIEYVFKKKDIKLFYEERKGIYKGNSFMLAAAILLFCKIYNENSYRNNLTINSASVFTGAIDSDLKLIPLPSESLRAKLDCIFFSWIKYAVIPKANLSEAQEYISTLNKKYPYRKLNIEGIDSITKIKAGSPFLKKENIPLIKSSGLFYKRHRISTASAAILILIIFIYSIFKFTIPVKIRQFIPPKSEMYLAFLPDRDTNWIFKNESLNDGDTINFGDAAIGDLWYPKIDFINNSDKKTKFRFEIEGENKNEFETVIRYEGLQTDAPDLLPDNIQRIYLKFRPLDYNSIGSKKAIFKVYPEDNPDNSKIIHLNGRSVLYDNGYSLLFKDPDEVLAINSKEVLIKEKFTISLWFKIIANENSSALDINLLRDDDGSKGKFYITYIPSDSTVKFWPQSNKSSLSLDLYTAPGKVKLNEWNYYSLIFNEKEITAILNDKSETYKNKTGALKVFPDILSIGGGKTPEKRDKEKYFKNYQTLLINNYKIWNTNINAAELIANKFNKTFEEKNLLLHYDFDEMNFETVYDQSRNEIWASTLGGVTRIMDAPAFEKHKKYISSEGNTVLHLKDKGLMFVSKDFFNKPSSFSLQLDVKHTENDSSYQINHMGISHPDFDLTYILRQNTINFGYFNKINAYKRENIIDYLPDKLWHRFTLTYSHEKDLAELYIDGNLFISLDSLKSKFDISRWYYGLSFGNANFFYAPRFLGKGLMLDNVMIYDKAIGTDEIKNNSRNGLIAYWTFEKIKDDLVFDEIAGLPAKLWEWYDFVKEEVK